MNILFLSYDGLTDPLGQSQILPYLIGLSQHGYHLTIISLEKPEMFQNQQTIIRKAIESFPIEWKPVHYQTGKGMLIKQKNNKALINAAFKLVESKKIQLIHARSYPASLIALKIKKKLNIPFIFDMRGFWADERVDGNIWNLNKPIHRFLYRYFKRKEQQLLLKSDHIISLTQAAKQHIVSTLCPSVLPQKITVIPCCADLQLFQPQQKNLALLQQLNISTTQPIILYSGSVGTWYLLDDMVDFFMAYWAQHTHALFLILTTKDHDLVHQTMRAKGIPDQHYRVLAANRNEMPQYISLAHLALYFIKPAFSKMASSPVKLGEYMACGIRVVCNKGIGDIDLHASLNDQIVVSQELNPEAYRQTILKLNQHTANSERAVAFAQQYYSLENGVELYKTVYIKLLQNA